MNRRDFSKTAALLAGGALIAKGQTIRAYVGTYSSPQGPEGAKGRGSGIYLLEMDSETGVLTQKNLFADPTNPSWLAFNSARTRLYVANEIANGQISAWDVSAATGKLTEINRVSSGGAGPCYVSLHPSAKFAFAANYHGGSLAVLPILEGGRLADASDVKHLTGDLGPEHATSAPPGSFAISGHERTHGHMILSDPSGKFVLAADLGRDRIMIFRIDLEKGVLTPNDPPELVFPAGDGPRHFAFHPNGRWLYSLQEEASTITTCDWDATRGTLKIRQTISTLPKGFGGTNFTSEVSVTADGRFVYLANRLHDTIAWCGVNKHGALTLLGEEWTRGDYPRSFTIDPSGRFLYSCNQRADAIACFHRDTKTGALSFSGHYTAIGTPAILLF